MNQMCESGWQGIEFLEYHMVGQTGYAKMVLNLALQRLTQPLQRPTAVTHSLYRAPHSEYQSRFIVNTKVNSQFKVELCSSTEIALARTVL